MLFTRNRILLLLGILVLFGLVWWAMDRAALRPAAADVLGSDSAVEVENPPLRGATTASPEELSREYREIADEARAAGETEAHPSLYEKQTSEAIKKREERQQRVIEELQSE